MNTIELKEKIKSEFFKYARVWNLLRKPTMKEFKMVASISAIGLLAIGAIGFLISILIHPFFI